MSDGPHRRFTGLFLPVDIIDAQGLRWIERLLWAQIHALFSHTRGGCFATNEHLARTFDIAEKSVANAITNLIEKGWLRRWKDGDQRMLMAVHPEPDFPKWGNDFPQMGNAFSPNGETPYIEKEKNENKDLCPPGGAFALEGDASKEIKAGSEIIEEIWKAYPNKEGKKKALDYIRQALRKKKITAPELLARTKTYALSRAGSDGKCLPFTPHGSTWFHEERWQDISPNPNPTSHDQSTTPPADPDRPWLW